MTTLDRYVARLLAQNFLYALIAMVTIFSVITLTEELRATEPPHYGIGAALVYVALNLASEAYGLFPASALLGAILALGQMMQSHEIVAVHAAGISPSRFGLTVLVAALLIGVAGIPFGEWVAAPLSQVARSRRALALSHGRMLNTPAGGWIRDGAQVIQVGEVHPDGSLSSLLILELEGTHSLRRVIRAESALPRSPKSQDKSQHTSQQWTLYNTRESTITAQGLRTRQASEQAWDVDLAPSQLRALWLRPEDLSMRELSQTSTGLRKQHLNNLVYEIAWLRRASAPIYIVLMVGLALAIVVRTEQRRLFGERLALAALAGLAFQMFQQMFTNFGVTAGLPAAATALAPAAIVLSTTLALWRLGGSR